MIEEKNISFIEDINPSNDIISKDKENSIEKLPIQDNKFAQPEIQSSDYIKELPNWDINPPLEINRGEK